MRGTKRSPIVVTDPETSRRMGGIRQKNTKPERAVRELLHALGHRYRVQNRDLPGSPDAANRSRQWAVFVHGCFWHAHTGCYKATVPKRNREFWLEKFRQNRARDRRAARALEGAGYIVVVVWECELAAPSGLRRRLGALLRSRRTRQ